MTPALECRALRIAYGDTEVLHEVDLAVGVGESVALLGPSGSGKTSLLYAIAGFLAPAGGEILLDGRRVSTARSLEPPERRAVAMVFQHYALWPHMTAVETVAYPMRRGGMSRVDARTEALAMLERLGLADLAHRTPAQLSGGEQQRVGLARAIAREPGLFLFDEPTAHLDTPLRAALQAELADRRARSGTAALMATHDVAEALAFADRVVLLRSGHVVQVGTPIEVYERPIDPWAARLTGPASVLEASLVGAPETDGRASIRIGESVVPVDGIPADGQIGRISVLVRPDWAALGGPLTGTVTRVWFRGPHTDYRLATSGGDLEIREAGRPRMEVGATTGWRLDRAWLLDAGA
ncbi:MAG: ABC transporter ATP-binding protein [Chloroflexota bacterium]|nr:ABC transporter ATP-binding protein [Chloroflexota bacterium]